MQQKLMGVAFIVTAKNNEGKDVRLATDSYSGGYLYWSTSDTGDEYDTAEEAHRLAKSHSDQVYDVTVWKVEKMATEVTVDDAKELMQIRAEQEIAEIRRKLDEDLAKLM